VADPGTRPPALRAYPNPFLTRTRIHSPGSSAREIAVYDTRGRLVRTLAVPSTGDGAEWDGLDDRGAPVPAGKYYARLDGPNGGTAPVVLLPR